VSVTPKATVVVVARDRWSQAPATLADLLDRTDRQYPVVVVDGGAPRPVAAAFDRLAASGRIHVTRRDRFLASNEARNIGADGARTEWLAFVENDTVMSDGWLDALIVAGEAHDATTTYPAYLQNSAGLLTVHGMGAELDVSGPEGARTIRERQHHVGRNWQEVTPGLEPIDRIQAEPHAILIRREFLQRIGGFDEGLLSWFDHTDLALHHLRHGATAWFVPDVTCTYAPPPPVSTSDLPSFLLRWGVSWFERSLDHVCTVWGLDREDSAWIEHARYGASVRRSVPTRSYHLNAVVDRVAVPVGRLVARRWEASWVTDDRRRRRSGVSGHTDNCDTKKLPRTDEPISSGSRAPRSPRPVVQKAPPRSIY
jgi:GT2 family glycosyltransferase